ncbi:hypothetical protein [Bythopirellula polymerisocia]|uniref:Uncharacterized protein n=1 Tax=Bythopirellula polymerisocia TaxID=2528003 RepID=A0A5C6C9B2_9BACT|nr:hypothetical protein [Bythopirellula polymerisocia]TWU21303.1 hypothetical protein Pla144_47130 [Bythopirellula polymerisocia]
MIDPTSDAVDKRLIATRGPLWHKSDSQKNRIPQGLREVECDSTWGYSKHDGLVQVYSFEVVVSATKESTVFPLLASSATACQKETTSFDEKIADLSEATENVLADSGYLNSRIFVVSHVGGEKVVTPERYEKRFVEQAI